MSPVQEEPAGPPSVELADPAGPETAAEAPPITPPEARGRGSTERPSIPPNGRRLLPVLLLLLFAVLLVVRGAGRFDAAAHQRAAAAVLAAPNRVVHELRPVIGARLRPAGEFVYRPGGSQLAVIALRKLAPVSGRERYLVFLEAKNTWVVAGAVAPNVAGRAEVRFDGAPAPDGVFQVVVCRATDDSDTLPHGLVVLDWVDVPLLPPGELPYGQPATFPDAARYFA